MVLKTMQTVVLKPVATAFPNVYANPYSKPMFKQTACILLSGRAGVGKTALANILKEEFRIYGIRAEKFSFASSLKEIARYMKWDGLKDARGRKFLQDIGQVARAYDPDIWCKTLFDYIIPTWDGYPYDVIMIDDWRFRNECTFAKNHFGYTVFRVRIVAPNRELLKGTPEYNDISEIDLSDNFTYDRVIDN